MIIWRQKTHFYLYGSYAIISALLELIHSCVNSYCTVYQTKYFITCERETLAQWWYNADPSSTTLAQYYTITRLTSPDYWVTMVTGIKSTVKLSDDILKGIETP